MFGFGLVYYLPQYFWVKEHPWLSFLTWALNIGIHLPCKCDGRIEVRVLGVSLSMGWTTLGHIRRAREGSDAQREIVAQLAERANKIIAEAMEKAEKSDENGQKDTKIGEKPVETDQKSSKPVYQGAVVDESGIRAVHVRDSAARAMLHSNLEWYMGKFAEGAKLIVSTDDFVNHNDRSFTLPDYEQGNTLEITDVVVFGDEKKHLAARITGYQQSPEGERTYFYQVAK